MKPFTMTANSITKLLWVSFMVSALWLTQGFWYNPLRFFIFPVVSMSGEPVAKTIDGVLLRIGGTKHRGLECQYVDTIAFGDRLTGFPIDLYIARVDRSADGKTRPAGTYSIGLYNIHPTATVSNIRVYVIHNCEGTKWASKIAELKL